MFVHCGVLTVGIRRKLGLPSPFDMRFSNPLDLHAIALRYPRMPFMVPHFGAGYLREALMLADLCPNVYLDTSSSNSWMRYEGLDSNCFPPGARRGRPGPAAVRHGLVVLPARLEPAVFEAQTQRPADSASSGRCGLIFGTNLDTYPVERI